MLNHHLDMDNRIQNILNLPLHVTRALVLCLVVISGCSKQSSTIIELMPAPEIYTEGSVKPFKDLNSNERKLSREILFGTDRKRVVGNELRYSNDHGFELRLGSAQIDFGRGRYSWEEFASHSLLKNRTENFALEVTDIKEFGVVALSLEKPALPESQQNIPPSTLDQFTKKVNDQLASSSVKDVYLYVPGFKVDFGNPLLVASELWHFLGYGGSFIAFSWPSAQSNFAYLADLENALISAHNLRLLIKLLAERTDLEHIHIIGYSAGTRIVLSALAQIALKHHGFEKQQLLSKYRIGHVTLIGSDVDHGLFKIYLADGLLNTAKTVTIYSSQKDHALSVSQLLHEHTRLGQKQLRDFDVEVIKYIKDNPELRFIDVTDAEGSTRGNGHSYFRKSPWVSSDILVTLLYDLSPEERGLVILSDLPTWSFPDDYIERLELQLQKQPN